MSMEDERARQNTTTAPAAGASATTTLETVPEVQLPPNLQGDLIPGAETEDEEERLLAQALAMSTQDGGDVEMDDAEGSFHTCT